MIKSFKYNPEDLNEYKRAVKEYPDACKRFVQDRFPSFKLNEKHNGEIRCLSPIRYPNCDNETSFVIGSRGSYQGWLDNGGTDMARTGDVIELAKLVLGTTFPKAVDYLADLFHIQKPKAVISVVNDPKQEILMCACDFFNEELWKTPKALDYVKSRFGGPRYESGINELKVGFAPKWDKTWSHLINKGFKGKDIDNSGLKSLELRVIFPYMKNGRCVYMTGRSMGLDKDPKSKYKKLTVKDGMTEHCIWGLDTIYNERGNKEKRDANAPIVIAEGVMDAISFYLAGYPVLSAVTGQFSGEQTEALQEFLRGHRVFVGMDYDPESHAGQKFTQKLAKELYMNGHDVRVFELEKFAIDKKLKLDINEMWMKNSSRACLEGVLAAAIPYQLYRVKHADFTDEYALRDDLKEFFREVQENRYHGRDEIAKYERRILEILKGSFFLQEPTVGDDQDNDDPQDNAQWKKFVQAFEKPVTQKEAQDMFEKRHEFFCMCGGIPYVWGGRCWVKKDHEWLGQQVQNIVDFCGETKTSSLVNGVVDLIEDTHKVEQMNRKKTRITLQNGTYDVERMEFFEDQYFTEDLNTIVLDINYSALAKAPLWESNISMMMGGDAARIALLQEWLGYCLTADCRQQKAMCFYGNGANGKSVVMSILQRILGDDNCSNLELTSFNKEFQLNDLRDKLVDISSEIRGDICAGVLDIFKKVVDGSPLTVNVKFKSQIKMYPICKLIFAVNDPPDWSSYNYAVSRRLLYVKFGETFVKDPDKNNSHQHKRDDGIIGKLLEERDGIFTWMVEGLKRLQAQGNFTSTDDTDEMERLLGMTSEMYDFVDWSINQSGLPNIFQLNKEFYYNEIYDRYRKYLKDVEHVAWIEDLSNKKILMNKLKKVMSYDTGRGNQGQRKYIIRKLLI